VFLLRHSSAVILLTLIQEATRQNKCKSKQEFVNIQILILLFRDSLLSKFPRELKMTSTLHLRALLV
jgi:hypothetical protein